MTPPADRAETTETSESAESTEPAGPPPMAGSPGAARAAEAAGLPADLWTEDPRTALRVGDDVLLDQVVHDATPGFTGAKAEGTAFLAARGLQLADLQERLYAQSRFGDERSVLLVVQGMDTAGKGGIARHVMGIVDPQGVALRAFGVPTPEEKKHHFLWRIKRALPEPGKIGLFDRSHYEDVLVGKVDKLAPAATIERRYGEINRFEKRLVEAGTTIIKVALLISEDEQTERLLERIDNPEKRWKYSAGDLDVRAKWDEYREAYQVMLERTSTPWAPWHVVPADRKWFTRLAVAEMLTRTLEDMDLTWPTVRWRPDVQRRRLAKLSSDAVVLANPSLTEVLSEEDIAARRESLAAAEVQQREILEEAERVAEHLDDGGETQDVDTNDPDNAVPAKKPQKPKKDKKSKKNKKKGKKKKDKKKNTK